MTWTRTANLTLDRDGDLWLAGTEDAPPRRLGPIESDPDLPDLPGLERERDELLDLWLDAARWDEAAQVRADYFGGISGAWIGRET